MIYKYDIDKKILSTIRKFIKKLDYYSSCKYTNSTIHPDYGVLEIHISGNNLPEKLENMKKFRLFMENIRQSELKKWLY